MSDGTTQPVTNSATWTSEDEDVATIDTAGLASAAGSGQTTISATVGAVSGYAYLAVTNATVTSIEVTPANGSVPKGLDRQFTAMATFSDNSQQNVTSAATWESSEEAKATIVPGGLATGVTLGDTIISASFGGMTGQTDLAVSSATIVSIAVSPTNQTIGSGATQQFIATATLSDSTTTPLDTANWTSSDEDVATIDTDGQASGVGAGVTTIIATQDGVSGTATLAVTANSVSGGPFAYVANFYDTVQAFTVDRASGALSPVSGGSASIGRDAFSAAADPSGRFLYVTNAEAVSAFVINPGDGTLSEVAGSPFAIGAGTPRSVAVDPTGRFVYVCSSGSNSVSAFAIDQASGALTAIGTVSAAGDFPQSVTVDPSGRFVYVANTNSHSLSAFLIDQTSGALTSVPGGPFPSVGAAPNRVSVHPSGRFLYLTYGATVTSPGSVMTFTVDPSDGSLTAVGSPVPTGSFGTFSLTVHPSGRFVYVGGDGLVSAFAVDPLTGSLTAVIGSPFPTGGIRSTDVTTDPSGRTLYVANFESGTVSAFTIDPISGSLTALPESPFPTNGLPQSIVITR